MPLDVIGAGFGRTGTLSLKLALEQLGLGPCHHMMEVLENLDTAEDWARAARGDKVDWDRIFAGYRSAVDFPTADYYRELAEHYPRAKVILTLRNPESWFRSTQNTIFGELNTMAAAPTPIGEVMRAIGTRNFGGRINDRETCIAGFERHNADVQRNIKPERLLVYRVAEGWEPLCRFLGLPVPATPFPASNSTEDFRAGIARHVGAGTG